MDLEKLLNLLPGLISTVAITILLVLRGSDLLSRGIECFLAQLVLARNDQPAHHPNSGAREHTIPRHI